MTVPLDSQYSQSRRLLTRRRLLEIWLSFSWWLTVMLSQWRRFFFKKYEFPVWLAWLMMFHRMTSQSTSTPFYTWKSLMLFIVHIHICCLLKNCAWFVNNVCHPTYRMSARMASTSLHSRSSLSIPGMNHVDKYYHHGMRRENLFC